MRRSFRFNLAALFIALTMFGAFLGFVTNRVIPQRRAVAAIREAGGQVKYDTVNSSWPRQKLAVLLGDDWCYCVRSVSLDGESCNDETVQCLKDLPTVSSLSLYTYSTTPGQQPGRISDDGMKIVANLPKLERVLVLRPAVSDVGLSYLSRNRNIKEVEVRGP